MLFIQFLEGLKTIWVRPGSISFLHTGFIVIGPIPKEKSFHLTTGGLLGSMLIFAAVKFILFLYYHL